MALRTGATPPSSTCLSYTRGKAKQRDRAKIIPSVSPDQVSSSRAFSMLCIPGQFFFIQVDRPTQLRCLNGRKPTGVALVSKEEWMAALKLSRCWDMPEVSTTTRAETNGIALKIVWGLCWLRPAKAPDEHA